MDWKTIDSMQIDLTSYCNARCGACTRNEFGGATVEGLSLNHFDTAIWERIFTQDLKDHNVNSITFNGMWGDPGMHPHLPEMLTVLHNSHPETIITSLATNGGTHTPEWWARLAKSLSAFKYHRVDFAFDGLNDTHEIYRRRVSYEKLMANATAFIENGGRAAWIMTVFDHNRHQLTEARALAKSMGFSTFRSRQSNASNIRVSDGDEQYEITTNNAQKQDFDNETFLSESPFIDRTRDSGCPWYDTFKVQLDPWHKIWPCCHIAAQSLTDQYVKVIDPITGEKIRVKEFAMQQEVYDQVDDKDFNNLENHSFLDILNHDWYQNKLSTRIKNKDLFICQRTCGINGEAAKFNV